MSVTLNGTSGLVFGDGTIQGTAAGMPFRNRIINGAFQIDNRNSFSSVSTSGFGIWACDRWIYNSNSANAHSISMQVVSDGPTPITGTTGRITNSLKFTVNTALTPPAGHWSYVRTVIEGYNVADLACGTSNASTMVLSFWVKSSLAGTFGCSVASAGYNISYAASYTINSANTWERKTIVIPGTSSGTWSVTTGQGLMVGFDLGNGSAYEKTVNTWSAGETYGPSGTVKLIATSAATWQVTGIQLEKATAATDFEIRPYTVEEILCARYFQTTLNDGYSKIGWHGFGTGNYVVHGYAKFHVPMRTTPTIAPKAYHLDASSINFGDGRTGLAVYGTAAGGGSPTYQSHTYGLGVTANRYGIQAFNCGDNTNYLGHYACGYTADAEI